MTAKVMFDTEKYSVESSAGRTIVGEDGKYTNDVEGYVVINKETSIIEHSSTMLPGAIFQCQHFNDTLISLLSPPVEEDIEAMTSMDVPEDILPN